MKWFIVFMMSVVIMVGVMLAFFAPTMYSGKEVFNSNREYIEFKEVVGTDGVSISEMLVLSSEPPIVVQYEVTAPRGMVFPYGDKDNVSPIIGYIFASFGLVGVIVMLFYKFGDD